MKNLLSLDDSLFACSAALKLFTFSWSWIGGTQIRRWIQAMLFLGHREIKNYENLMLLILCLMVNPLYVSFISSLHFLYPILIRLSPLPTETSTLLPHPDAIKYSFFSAFSEFLSSFYSFRRSENTLALLKHPVRIFPTHLELYPVPTDQALRRVFSVLVDTTRIKEQDKVTYIFS